MRRRHMVRRALQLIEEGLQLRLRAQHAAPKGAARVKLPVLKGQGGLARGVDPRSNQSMLQAAEDMTADVNVTHPKVFVAPTPVAAAVAFVDALLALPGVRMPEIGAEWPRLRELCVAKKLSANDVPDAWLAAAVRELGDPLVTFDAGFRRLLGRSEFCLLDA